MADLLAILFYPFLAACVFVGIHTWFGLQVLQRKVVFADLALAQLSALGGTIAVAAGYPPGGLAGFGYALALTLVGAGLLTTIRGVSARIGQEAIIGILYVVATAVTVLVVDRSPQGAEHVKRMLVGDILTVTGGDLLKLVLLYGLIGTILMVCRRPLLAAAQAGTSPNAQTSSSIWDFVFYATFGVVVTSSVAVAGVLLVFTFLIIPAVAGSLFSVRMHIALAIGWSIGVLASLVGFVGSVAFDVPTGAAVVVGFAAVLLGTIALRALFVGPQTSWRKNQWRAIRFGVTLSAAVVLAQGLWLIAFPAGDHPLVVGLERVLGLKPERYLTGAEQHVYREAAEVEQRNRAEVERLSGMERDARWRGDALSEQDVRRISSFQQTFNEMGRGERFVQDHLRVLARERQRWYVGLPAIVIAGLVLIMLFRLKKLRFRA